MPSIHIACKARLDVGSWCLETWLKCIIEGATLKFQVGCCLIFFSTNL